MREYDPELLEAAWSFFEREYECLERVCKIALRRANAGQRFSVREAMSEVADRLPGIIENFQPGRAALKTHVVTNVKWYLFKMLRSGPAIALNKRDALIAMRHDTSYTPAAAHELSDEVQSVMDKIHPYYRAILQMYYMQDQTLAELAGVLGVSLSSARKDVGRAMDMARQAASELR